MKWILGVGFLVGCGGALAPFGLGGDDGDPKFSAKVRQGCHSLDECKSLRAEAEERRNSCAVANKRKCDREYNDRSIAESLLRDMEKEAEETSHQQHQTARAEHEAETKRLKERIASLGDSCRDVAELEAMATKEPDEITAETYRKAANSRRAGRVSSLRIRIESGGLNTYQIAQLKSLDKLTADIQAAKASLVDLECYDPKAAAALREKALERIASAESALNTERVCRDSATCMMLRDAEPICTLIGNRKMWADDMAKERRNPSGYVNTKFLHDMGTSIQQADEELPGLKAEFQAEYKKPFVASMCSKK